MDCEVFKYSNKNIGTIYRYTKKIEPIDNNKKLIIACNTSMEHKNLSFFSIGISILIKDAMDYDCYKKIELINFSSIINHITCSIDSMNNLNDFFFNNNLDGVNYNILNNKIKELLDKNKKNDVIIFTDGSNPFNDCIDKSTKELFDYTKKNNLDFNLKIVSPINNYDGYIIDIYKKYFNNELFIVNSINLFNQLIMNILDSIPTIIINNLKIPFLKNKNNYYLDLFDFCFKKKPENINESVINISINQQIHCFYSSINYLNEKLNDDKYKKILLLNEYFNNCKNLEFRQIEILEDINKLIKLKSSQIIDKGIGTRLIEYHQRTKKISKKNKFSKIYDKCILNNSKNIKTIDSEIDIAFNNNKIQKFIKKFEGEQRKNFKKSNEVFYSLISISNWFEELQEKNIMGLLIKTSSSTIGKVGVNINCINIKNITTTILPIDYLLDSSNIYYEKYNNLDYGESCYSMISGNSIGEGNALMPLYISKEHWKITKPYFKPMIGIMVAQNPLMYNDKHIQFVFMLLFDMINKTFDKTKKNINEKWLYTLFSLYRTCYEISKEKNYDKGIKNLYNNFMKKSQNRGKDKINYLDSFLCQLLLSNLYIKDDFILYVYEEYINRFISDILPKKMTFLNLLKKKNKKYIFSYDNFYNIKHNILDNIENKIINFIKFNEIIECFRSNYKCINNFIKELDRNFGLINDSDMKFLKMIIKRNLNKMLDDKFITKNINIHEFKSKCILKSLYYKNNKSKLKNCIIDIYTTNKDDLIKFFVDKYNNKKSFHQINYKSS